MNPIEQLVELAQGGQFSLEDLADAAKEKADDIEESSYHREHWRNEESRHRENLRKGREIITNIGSPADWHGPDEWREMWGHLARLIAACDALYAGQPHSNEDMQRARDFLAKPQPTTESL